LARLAFDVERTAVSRDDVVRDAQAEPDTAGGAR
jgi:hypothetical protein